MKEQLIEKEIQAKNLNAPRLTPDLIDSKISSFDFHVFQHSCLTVCCITLENGFTVTGESACASPENFDEEIGRKIAIEQARNKIWMLEGYLLKQKLFKTPNTLNEKLKMEQTELREKLDKLVAFIDTEIFIHLSVIEQELLVKQSDHMLAYLGVLEHRIMLDE